MQKGPADVVPREAMIYFLSCVDFKSQNRRGKLTEYEGLVN